MEGGGTDMEAIGRYKSSFNIGIAWGKLTIVDNWDV